MSILSALGARALPAPLFNASQQNSGKTSDVPANRSASALASPVSLSNDALDLQKRVDSVGNATVDLAQNLLNSFAQKLFGDAGKNADISFDSASLETSSSFSAAALHTEGPNGSSDAAAFQLTDSSHFIGKGTITTADGRKFDFEVEIQYNYELDAAASQTRSTGSGPAAQLAGDSAQDSSASDGASGKPDAKSAASQLPTIQVPNIDFPGSLADLFKLIGRDLQTALSTGSQPDSQANSGIDRNTLRSLSLRLLNLVDSKNDDTYSAQGQSSSASRAKSAADAYGTQAASAADAPVANPAPAAAPATPAVATPAAAAPAAPDSATSPALAANDDQAAAANNQQTAAAS